MINFRQLNFKSKKVWFVGVVNILCLIFVMIIIFNRAKISVLYNNKSIDNDIVLNIGEKFSSPKVTASYFGYDLTHDIEEQKTDIDTSKPGEYEITYRVTSGFFASEKKVKVIIKDTEPPKINLLGDQNIKICQVSDYVEQGYNVTDNYSSNLNDKVEKTMTENKIIYTVSDDAGNKTSVERVFIICDEESPKITLNGSETLYIPLNTEFQDPGVTITDNCDKSINPVITGTVDTTKAGKYDLTYNATDKDKNTASIVRSVYVYNPESVSNVNGGTANIIYLTFDDGPGEYTNQILDILKKYNIKATFFVTGKGQDNIIKREFDEGHTIGLHTYTHKWDVYTSVNSYFNDLDLVSNRVESITGQKSTLIRFPGGSSNTISKRFNKGIMTSLTSMVLEKGYHYFDWNVCVEDNGQCVKAKGDNDKKTCVISHFQNGLSHNRSNVVLMHDIKSYTANSLEEMINYAIQNGYVFDKITMDTTQIHQRVNN
jgi:peptidoglycan/xylan/chitin deacetylase (PgdA/CDA1 family)